MKEQGDQNKIKYNDFVRNNVFTTEKGPNQEVIGLTMRSLNDHQFLVLNQHFKHLQKIGVQYTICQDTLILIAKHYPSLKSFICSYKSADSVFSAFLAQLKNIEELGLRSSLISDHFLSLLPEVLSLKSLDLSRNAFSSSGLQHLAKFPNLVSLKLDKNAIDNKGAIIIVRQFPQIKQLSLWGCLLTNWGAIAIASLKKLEHLNLGVNNIAEVGFMKVINNSRKSLQTLKMWGAQVDQRKVSIAKKISRAKKTIL